MPSEAIRCSDCGATFKGVPSWLRGAKVKFTCTNCPKRPSRLARYEPPVASAATLKSDTDLETAEIEDLDEEADLDLPEDLDDPKEEKDIEEKDIEEKDIEEKDIEEKDI